MTRRIELGIVTQRPLDEVAAAVAAALDVPLHERDGLDVGGGVYRSNWSLDRPDPEVHLVDNYREVEDDRQNEDHEVAFVLRFTIDAARVEPDELLRRLDGACGEWRLLDDETW